MNYPGNGEDVPEIRIGPYKVVRHMKDIKQGENPKIFIEFDQPVNPQEIVLPKLIMQLYPLLKMGTYIFETHFDGKRCIIECKPPQKENRTYVPDKKSLPSPRISEVLRDIMGERGWGKKKIMEGMMEVRNEKIENIKTTHILIKRLPLQTNIFLRFNEAGQLLSASEGVPGRIRGMDPSTALGYIVAVIETMNIVDEFSEDVEGACEIASDLQGEIPLQNLSTYDALAMYETIMMRALQIKLGFDFYDKNIQPKKQYTTEGTPGTEGEGRIVVSVFETKKPGVFIGKYEHNDGDVVWTIRAFDIEE